MCNGYITHRWWQIYDETGRRLFFYQHPCSYELIGIHGEKSYLTTSVPPGVIPYEFSWHRLDGLIYKFENHSYLMEITDPNGNRQLLTYNTDSQLETVADEATG